MKKSLIYVTPIILITLATTFPGKKKITALEMFDKVVQYYDPNGTWDTFSGSMRMHTIFDNEISIEDLTIDNKKGYYQSTRHFQDSTFSIGKEQGQAFFKINGTHVVDQDVPDRLRAWPYRLNADAVKNMSEHHLIHFSMPLVYKKAGAKPLPKVGTATLYGKNYSTLSFSGLPNAQGPNYKDVPITIYVDTKNGYRIDAIELRNNWGKDQKGGIAIFKGELEINGLKIPARKIYLNRADMSYVLMDAFERM